MATFLQRLRIASLQGLRAPGLPRDLFFIVLGTVIGALGGVIYWKIVTARFPVFVVGLGATAIFSATFLGGLSNLGLSAALVRFLPGQQPGGKGILIASAQLAVLATSLLIALIFLAGRSLWAPNLIPAGDAQFHILCFILLTVSTSEFAIVGGILQAERLTHFLPVQFLVFNVVQIGAGLMVPLWLGATGLLLSYALPTIVVAVGFTIAIPHLAKIGRVDWKTWPLDPAEFFRYALGTHLFNQLWGLPILVFPLMVLKLLGPEANAGLTIAWYAYNFLYIIPSAASVALLVDGAHDPAALGRRLYTALLLNLSLLVPLVAVLVGLAPWLLGLFGPAYVRSAPLLRILALSVLPVSVSSLYLTLHRVRKKIFNLNLLTALLSVGSIFLSYLMTRLWGVEGIGWGWLTGQTAFTLAVTPFIVREYRSSVKAVIP